MSAADERPVAAGAPAHIILSDGAEQAELTDLLHAVRSAVRAGRGVIVDCGAASFLPTALLQILIASRRTCRERGLPFAVEGVQESAAVHLRRAGLGAVLDS